MWRETTRHWNNKIVDLGGEIFTEPKLMIDNKKKWFMLGFTTKETGATKEGGGGKFQGYHERNICVIVTEAQAIPDEFYDQIDGVATSQNCLVIFIGNPTRAKEGSQRGFGIRRIILFLIFPVWRILIILNVERLFLGLRRTSGLRIREGNGERMIPD